MTQIDTPTAFDTETDYRHYPSRAREGVTLTDDGEYVLADEANETTAFIVSDTAVDLEAMS